MRTANLLIPVLLVFFSTSSFSQGNYPPPPKDPGNDPALSPKKSRKRAPRKWQYNNNTPTKTKTAPNAQELIAPANLTPTEKYEYCFEKMVDAGETNNKFIRRCLGIVTRSTRLKKNNKGMVEFLEKEDAIKAFQTVRQNLLNCYSDHAMDAKKKGILSEGYFEPILTVKNDGSVTRVSFSKRTISDVKLLGCFKSHLYKTSFPPFSRKKTLKVHHGFKLSAKGKPSMIVLKNMPIIKGIPGYTAEEKLEVYKIGTPKITACYDTLLKTQPNVVGRMGAKLAVSPAGRVVKVTLMENTLYEPNFVKCTKKAIRSYKFPKSRVNTNTSVYYPYIFALDPKDVK
jgi:hypothetical protein